MITLGQTIKKGIMENFKFENGMSKEDNEEVVLRNNIINTIRFVFIDEDGKMRDTLYFPVVKYSGDAQNMAKRITEQMEIYKKLRDEFVRNSYAGIEIYDNHLKQATKYVNLVGLDQNKLLEDILN